MIMIYKVTGTKEQKSLQVVIVCGSIVGVWYRHKEETGPSVIVIEIEQFQQPVSQPGGRTGIDGSNSSGRWRDVRPIISCALH